MAEPLIADKKLLIIDADISGENKTGQTCVFKVLAPSLDRTLWAAFLPILDPSSNFLKSLEEEYQ